MGKLMDLINKIRSEKEELKEEQRRQKMLEKIEQMKLSANERELNSYLEHDRQNQIKIAVEKYRKIRQNKLWGGRDGNPIFTPDVVNHHEKIFTNKNNLFSGKKNLMSGSNLFFRRAR